MLAVAVSLIVLIAPAAAQAARHERAQVRISGPGRAVPTSFLGLSVEVNELESYLRAGPAFDRAIKLIRPAAGGPVNLRIGGKSADDAYWGVGAPGAPPWVFEVGGGWLNDVAALAHRDELHVTLGLNLAVHSPTMAASFARAALQSLGAKYLAGLAVGNEPDLFRFQPGLAEERVATTIAGPRWPNSYSASDYRHDYVAYARSLARSVPGVPLVGPEITHPDARWLDQLTGLQSLRPRVLTLHRYPFSTCWPKTTFAYPRFSSLLAERASSGLARSLGGMVRIARHAGLPLWLSEVNSASCGGKIGVTDTFATALWAPDLLFELLRAGLAGVNWHMRPGLANAPFLLHGVGIRPLPELYGLALFARLMAPGARLEHVRAQTHGMHVKVWAVRSQRGLSVLFINKSGHRADVSLRSAGTRLPASMERLSAPSTRSVFGVRLAGQWIGQDARWHGRIVRSLIRPRRGTYGLTVPGYSAALVQLAPDRARLTAARSRPQPPQFRNYRPMFDLKEERWQLEVQPTG